MRPQTLALAWLLMQLAGCTGVHWSRGIPDIAKPTDGSLIRGAEGIPDIQRGNQARLAGRLDDAERDLLPLAEQGYVDARLYLAAVYGHRESVAAQNEAIRWYQSVLAERPETAVPLARVYVRRGDRRSVAEAEKLLLFAERERIEPAASAALLDLYGQFPELDTAGRAPALAAAAEMSETLELRTSAINWYRASIADKGRARRLLELCRKNLEEVPSCYVDLATYYRYSGNDKALDALVTQALENLGHAPPEANFDRFDYDPIELPSIAARLAVAMVDQPLAADPAALDDNVLLTKQAETIAQTAAGDESVDSVGAPGVSPQIAPVAASLSVPVSAVASPTPAHPEHANRILRWMLKEPRSMPVEAAGIAVSFPYLLPDVDVEVVLKAGVAAGIPRASLFLGELYYFNQRIPREPALGEASLLQSLKFRETTAPGHYRLGRLYQQGYLGRPDPQKALDNFIVAGRRRVTAADTHLARLFYDSPGARINRVNAYVFARLSEDGGIPVIVHSLRDGVMSSYKLLDSLHAELTAEELQQAEALYQREREVHLVTRPPVSPEVWVREAG